MYRDACRERFWPRRPCWGRSTPARRQPARAERGRPTDASVLAVGARVADWQLSHMDNFDYVPDAAFRHDTRAPRDWIQAAFYIGLAAVCRRSPNPVTRMPS